MKIRIVLLDWRKGSHHFRLRIHRLFLRHRSIYHLKRDTARCIVKLFLAALTSTSNTGWRRKDDGKLRGEREFVPAGQPSRG